MSTDRRRLPRLPLRDARCVALQALLYSQRTRELSSVSLERTLRESEHLDPRDAGLAREMVAGCVRRRLTLDCLIDAHLRRAPATLDAELREILRLTVYQCLWLDRVPNRAAVNEAVKLARAITGDGPAGMVNAVMRALLDCVSDAPPTDETPPTAIIPIDTDRDVAMTRPYLPDPLSDRAEYLAMATSHPVPLVQRWIRRHGLASAEVICRYGADRPHQWLRVNLLRGTAAGLIDRLRNEGASVEPHDDVAVRYVAGPVPISLPSFTSGLFQPQDLTAISAVRTLAPGPGEVVVDYCAGVGTKTAAIAEFAGDHATVVATDREVTRLEAARRDLDRLGISSVRTVPLDQLTNVIQETGPPDAILVDVPCSNSGVLARRPDARYRVDATRLKSLGAKQRAILSRTAEIAGDQTRIVYSTCSLEPEENEGQVERFCEEHPGWHVTERWLTLPTPAAAGRVPCDGGFCAVLRRADETRAA